MTVESNRNWKVTSKQGEPRSRRAVVRDASGVGLGAAILTLAAAGNTANAAVSLRSLTVASSRSRLQTASPSPGTTSRTAGEVVLLISGYDSPEGPAFDVDGNLFFVNWLSSSIVKLTPDGQATEFANTGGIPAGLAFHPDGSLYVADEGDDIHGVMRITPDGTSEILVNEYQGKPLNGANDLMFDAEGVLYFTDPWGSWVDNPIGGFYRLHPDGKLDQLDTGLAFPNGVAVTADGSAVIIAETGGNRLLRYEIGADGSVGPREVWAELEPAAGGPDGMAFDENGDLYVAHYGAGHVDVFDPAGTHVDEIEAPGAELTNVAFGGPDNKTLVITDVTTGSLYAVQMNVAGQPLYDGRSA